CGLMAPNEAAAAQPHGRAARPRVVTAPCRIPRRRLHRWVFAAAGVYNLAWGAWAAVDPQWLFRFARMPPLSEPAIFACLGMVVGIYGFLYLEVARVPERGFAIGAVGLLGKVLGPIGLARLIAT